MKVARLYWSAGIAGIIGGVINVIAEFLGADLALPLNLLINLFLPWVLTALYLAHREAMGRLGFAGYVVNTLGLLLVIGLFFAQSFVLASLDPALVEQLMAGRFGLVAISSVLVLVVGTTLFGIAMFRTGAVPRWAALLYSLGFILAVAAPFVPRAIGLVAEFAISLGVIGLSYTLIARARQVRR